MPPASTPARGETVMELLCSEVLASAGIPAMELSPDRWPVWQMPGHVLLNDGRMQSLQALGDILIPCAPTNLVISIKSEAARERLLYSANSIEGIGFGFFKEPEEFWTASRMSLYKRMGFTAIYMPDATCTAVMIKVVADGNERHAINSTAPTCTVRCRFSRVTWRGSSGVPAPFSELSRRRSPTARPA